MLDNREINAPKPNKKIEPILKLNRIKYVKVSGKILEQTKEKLDKYIEFAGVQMNETVTSGDCLEHALNMLFARDSGFKKWLKK